MQHKIKLLQCGGEQPSSIISDVFRIFKAALNDDFHSLVQNYSRMYDEGEDLEYEWLLNTLVSKYKQLVSEGDWKIKDDEPNMVAMIQKLESKNQELTKALNNLAEKTLQAFTAQNSQSNGSRN